MFSVRPLLNIWIYDEIKLHTDKVGIFSRQSVALDLIRCIRINGGWIQKKIQLWFFCFQNALLCVGLPHKIPKIILMSCGKIWKV